jgi:hypothetical protein
MPGQYANSGRNPILPAPTRYVSLGDPHGGGAPSAGGGGGRAPSFGGSESESGGGGLPKIAPYPKAPEPPGSGMSYDHDDHEEPGHPLNVYLVHPDAGDLSPSGFRSEYGSEAYKEPSPHLSSIQFGQAE